MRDDTKNCRIMLTAVLLQCVASVAHSDRSIQSAPVSWSGSGSMSMSGSASVLQLGETDALFFSHVQRVAIDQQDRDSRELPVPVKQVADKHRQGSVNSSEHNAVKSPVAPTQQKPSVTGLLTIDGLTRIWVNNELVDSERADAGVLKIGVSDSLIIE